MLREIDQYYAGKEEPVRGCLLAIREIVLALDNRVTETWKYQMPFFCYSGKMFCYLRIDKRTNGPYIGIVEGHRIQHPELEKGKRVRMKIVRIDPAEDLPIESMELILNEALDLYRKGIIKLPKRK